MLLAFSKIFAILLYEGRWLILVVSSEMDLGCNMHAIPEHNFSSFFSQQTRIDI
jgi:hypothetical protein